MGALIAAVAAVVTLVVLSRGASMPVVAPQPKPVPAPEPKPAPAQDIGASVENVVGAGITLGTTLLGGGSALGIGGGTAAGIGSAAGAGIEGGSIVGAASGGVGSSAGASGSVAGVTGGAVAGGEAGGVITGGILGGISALGLAAVIAVVAVIVAGWVFAIVRVVNTLNGSVDKWHTADANAQWGTYYWAIFEKLEAFGEKSRIALSASFADGMAMWWADRQLVQLNTDGSNISVSPYKQKRMRTRQDLRNDAECSDYYRAWVAVGMPGAVRPGQDPVAIAIARTEDSRNYAFRLGYVTMNLATYYEYMNRQFVFSGTPESRCRAGAKLNLFSGQPGPNGSLTTLTVNEKGQIVEGTVVPTSFNGAPVPVSKG